MIWLYASFGGIGMILLIVGILMVVFENRKKERCAYESTAVICDAKKYHRGIDDPRMYYAIYEYEYGGKIYHNESKNGSSIKPTIGQKVTIHINPNKPEEYYIKSVAKIFVYFLLIGLGIIFIGLAVILFLVVGL